MIARQAIGYIAGDDGCLGATAVLVREHRWWTGGPPTRTAGRRAKRRIGLRQTGIDGLALAATQGRLQGQFTATLQPLPGNPQGPQTVTLRFDTPYPTVREPQAEP